MFRKEERRKKREREKATAEVQVTLWPDIEVADAAETSTAPPACEVKVLIREEGETSI